MSALAWGTAKNHRRTRPAASPTPSRPSTPSSIGRSGSPSSARAAAGKCCPTPAPPAHEPGSRRRRLHPGPDPSIRRGQGRPSAGRLGDPMKPLNAFLAFAGAAYVYDVVWRPGKVADCARAAARRRGKPLLNVGAGTPGSSLRTLLLGPTLFGEVNCNLAAPRATACGGAVVCPCDVHRLPFGDKQFGAVIASHVLEHVEEPESALAELRRVADGRSHHHPAVVGAPHVAPPGAPLVRRSRRPLSPPLATTVGSDRGMLALRTTSTSPRPSGLAGARVTPARHRW